MAGSTMVRPLRGSVVVVTGATSGVGRASAHAFADGGAKLVLVARDPDELGVVADECRRRGAEALAVPADISVASEVDEVIGTSILEHGRIDTFVSAAAVLLAGHLGDERVDEIERVVATNVLGTTLCARAAVRRFRQQEHGVLVLVSSLLGVVQNPLVPVYVSSKFAVRGLALSLHQDLAKDPAIHVSCVLPGPVDTPMFERAANHTGRRLRAIPPAVAPERAAAVVVACARRPRREAVVGWAGRGIVIVHRLAPRTTERAVARASAALLTRAEPAPPSDGALFGWGRPGSVSGGWRRGPGRARLGALAGRWSNRVRGRRST
jgi:short-subunit dehydrogenase